MANRKNANGMGSWYFDKKRELWVYRITADGRLKSFSGRTQEIALGKYDDWKRGGQFVSLDPNITMAEWSQTWFDAYREKIEPGSISSYKTILGHIIKTIGHMKVKDIRVGHIEKFLDDTAQKYSVSQTGHIRTMLGQILRKAEANELIFKNPVPLADRMNYRRMGKKRKSKKDAWTAPEVITLMNELPHDWLGHSARLMLGTSLSTQELLGLSALDIAADGSMVSVRRAVKLKEGGGMYIGDVKAEKRERDIPVPPSVRPSAKFLRENAKMAVENSDGEVVNLQDYKKEKSQEKIAFIIPGKLKDMPMHPSTFRDYFKETLKNINVRLLTPHCCRHTYISHLEDRKADFAVIQALAGQSEQQSTINYIHAQSPSIAAAVNEIEKLLTGK